MNKESRGKIALLLMSVAMTLVLFELAIRAIDHRKGIGFFGDQRNPLAEKIPGVLPFRTFGFDPYRTVDGEVVISDTCLRQFPLKKKEGTFRIVCFGGSTTAHQVGGADYPGILQRLLISRSGRNNIEVINAGNSSYTTAHSKILLALNALSWEPDLIIMSHNINDLTVLYFPGFRPDYWNKYMTSYFFAPDFRDRYTWHNVLFQHSRLYWFLSRAAGNRGFRDLEKRGHSIRRAPFDDALVQRGAAIFKRNVETFVAIAQARDIPVILGTQPHEPSEEFFVRHMGYKPYNDVALYPPHDQHLQLHKLYNQQLRDVASARGTGLVDNEANFNGERTFFTDHVHYTDAGLWRLAQNYASAIMADHLHSAN